MNPQAQFRKPTKEEQTLLQRLLEAEFPGKEQLAPMVQDMLVRPIDEAGSLELRTQANTRATLIKRIPVEAEAKDKDGVTIHVLLHVVDGRPIELEIFKDDSSRIKYMPLPSAFELIVLPPAGARGQADSC